MKNNKKTITIEIVDDKVYMKHSTGNVGLTVDVTPIFNFGMFVQKVMEHPEMDTENESIQIIGDNNK